MWLYEVLFHGGVTKWKKETQDNGWTSCVSYIFDIEIVMVMLSQRCKSWNALTDRVVGSGVIQAFRFEGATCTCAWSVLMNQMIVFLIFTCKTVNHYLKYFCHSWKIWTLLKSYTTTLLYNSLCTIWGHIEKGTWGIFKDQYDLMRKQDGDFLWNQMWKCTQCFINKREWR